MQYNATHALSDPEKICPPTEKTCSLNASTSILETCEYKWWQSTTRLSLESPVLILTSFTQPRDGFECIVTCQVRGRTCRIQLLAVNSTDCSGLKTDQAT